MNRYSIVARKQQARLVILIASIGFLLWRLASPKVADDFPYSYCLQSADVFAADDNPRQRAIDAFWSCQSDEISSWSEVVSSSINHYSLINGRFANMLALASAMLPMWVVDLIHALMFVLMLVMIMRLSTPDWHRNPLLTLLLALSVWIVMPWEDNMASSDFLINYVWSSALILTFIDCRRGRQKGWKILLTALLGFVSAMMHEGFALSFSLLIVAMLLKDLKADFPIKEKILSSILPTTTYLLGMAVVMSSPALWQLFGQRQEWQLPLNFFVYNLGIRLWPFYLALILCLVAWRVKRKRGVADSVDIYGWVATALISCAIAIISSQADRALWPAYLVAIIICISRCEIMTRRIRPLPMMLNKLLFTLGCLTLIAWQSALAYHQRNLSQQQSLVAQRLEETRRPLIYADVSSQGDLPWWLFEIPAYINNSGETARFNLYASVMKTTSRPLMILPEKYKTLPLDSLPEIDGNAGLRGVFPTYYSPNRLCDTMLLHFGRPGCYPPAGNVNPIYSLRWQLPTTDPSASNTISITRRMEESMIVTAADTAWFYRVIYTGRSLAGLPLLRIDTLP